MTARKCLLILVGVFIEIIAPRTVYAQITASPEYVAHCVIGEAEDQGFSGMLAVSYAIRNRGSLKGVFGCKAPRVLQRLYSKQTERLALKAWRDSETGQDITGGATHWEAVARYGMPWWSKKMRKTVTIKDHTFFRK